MTITAPEILEEATAVATASTAGVPTDTYPHRWRGLMAVLAATLLNLLDTTVGNIASPAIRGDLGGSTTTLQWMAAAYTIALAVGLLTGGRLGDMYGRKRMLLIGAGAFVAASAACALAWSPESLIAARVAQGLAGAVMVPQGFGLIRDMFGRDMGKAFAAFGPAIGLATILGPVVAGALIDLDLWGTGWRMIFLINVPLGLAAIVAGRAYLPASAPNPQTRLDVRGALIAAAGMALLVYPLISGREAGWPAWAYSSIAASVVIFGAFVAQQVRRGRSGRTALVELSVFAKRSYTSGVAFVVAFFGACVGFGLAVGLFLQLGLGYDALGASVAMATWPIGAFLGTGFGASMMTRLGRHILHIGLTMMAAGLAGLYVVITGVGTDVTGWTLALPLLVYGAGMGMIFIPLFDIIVADLADHEVGSASGMLESFQQLGATLGIAVLGTVYFSITDAVDAAGVVTLLTIGLTAISFGLAFLLPKRAKATY